MLHQLVNREQDLLLHQVQEAEAILSRQRLLHGILERELGIGLRRRVVEPKAPPRKELRLQVGEAAAAAERNPTLEFELDPISAPVRGAVQPRRPLEWHRQSNPGRLKPSGRGFKPAPPFGSGGRLLLQQPAIDRGLGGKVGSHARDDTAPTIGPMLLLASTSPYRRALLGRLGLPFACRAPGVDETPQPDEAPLSLAVRLARAKAQAILTQEPEATVIGSDQVAICSGRLLDKPGTVERALDQLRWQRGRITEFHTAYAVLRGARACEGVVSTRVVWRSAEELTDQRLAAYVALENPLDCAGAAKSEGLGIALLNRVESPDPTALIGLPLIAICQALTDLGLELLPDPASA